MMEDAMSEDTMMDCGSEEEGVDELVDLTSEIPDSVPNIRDAAERLLTLLGVEDDDSSSEDEGVELDLDDELPENSRFLHQLATSLVQELKYTQKSTPLHPLPLNDLQEQIQHMDVSGEDVPMHQTLQNHQNSSSFAQIVPNPSEKIVSCRSNPHYVILRTSYEGYITNKRCRIDEDSREAEEDGDDSVLSTDILGSWTAGWEACATEAVRYLLEVEGLPPQHPKVLSLKSHLEVQKGRAFAQFSA
ncbi:uncharacterized protein LOC107039606 [Diachasma alloeum]|uniref:uncharacterized protein LOC107039606 n=1 Tax=Diachasma alloeum TaxID=454923 RepID=UPI0007383B93|nr:uncharacterized protein LOC107039606 [Diachasma alloeum]